MVEAMRKRRKKVEGENVEENALMKIKVESTEERGKREDNSELEVVDIKTEKKERSPWHQQQASFSPSSSSSSSSSYSNHSAELTAVGQKRSAEEGDQVEAAVPAQKKNNITLISRDEALGPGYCLSNNDLKALQVFKGRSRNIFDTSRNHYRLRDLKRAAIKKHGSEEGIGAAAKKRLQRKNFKAKQPSWRKLVLINALGEYQLQLRSDSKLCASYIAGTTTYTLNQVVERMCEMKYLYEYCSMDKWLRQAERECAALHSLGVFDLAEFYALEMAHGYPPVWPWMIGSDSEWQ